VSHDNYGTVALMREASHHFHDGAAGLRVVKLLEAADRSLKEKGKAVQL